MSNEESLVQMISRFNAELYNRVTNGDFEYAKDLATLDRYFGIAYELEAFAPRMNLYNTLGTLHFQACYPSRAIGAWQEAMDIHLQHAADELPVVMFNYNIAQALALLDRHEQAANTLDRLYEDFLSIEGAVKSYGYLLLMIVADTIYSQLQLNRLHDALNTNERLSNMNSYLSITYNRQYTRALVKLWGMTAELFLAQGNLEEAWSTANLGYEQATALNDAATKASFAFTHQHIAEQDTNHQHPPAHYDATAHSDLAAVQSAAGQARVLLLEARYRRTQGYVALQQRLAKAAHDLFEDAGAEEGLQLALSLTG